MATSSMLGGVEGLAAGGLGDGAEDLVALVSAGADVRADGVDDGLGALTHLDGVGLLDAAVVVVSVGDEDEGAADGDPSSLRVSIWSWQVL